MRLKFGNFELEGKDLGEIEKLLALVDQLEARTAKVPNESRGRREKFIDFPKGEFIVADLADDLGISAACVYQRLKAMEASGDAKIVRQIRKKGARGRGKAVWLVTNPDNQFKNEPQQKAHSFDVNLDEPPE